MARSQKAVVVAVVAAVLIASGVASAFAFAGHARGAHPAATQVTPKPVRAARSAVRTLPALRRLTPPDAMVTLPAPVTAHQLARVKHLYDVRAVAVADQGDMNVGGHRVRVLGLALGARGFTPRFTAVSRPLWLSLLRGDMTVDFSLAGRMRNALGATLPVSGRGASLHSVRVGAFATIGLGATQALVDSSMSGALRLSLHRVLIVSAPDRSIDGLRSDLQWVLGPRAHVHIVRPQQVNQAVISVYAQSVIPAGYLRLYRAAAATCRGLPWTVLAAIGTVETGNGANTSTSSKGAMGPMQFLPSTFVAYAVDGDGDGVANIQDPADAIYSAARYLCAWGAGLGGQSLYAAIFAYNHADWYVRAVIRLAVAYS
ncbi:MAG TPA: lytic transglycosylase domain-containing protein [Mycobacteriales bacterium]|nr:lytic transglycosylase domain-containing protein [Mycobacteriales bacterium]